MAIKLYTIDEEKQFRKEFLDNNKKEMTSNLWTNIILGLGAFGLIFLVMVAILGLTSWSIIITIVAWLILVGFSIEKYSLTVPALQLWIATDYFQKDANQKLVPYRTGFHFKKLWHGVDQTNKIDLKKQVTVQSLGGWGCTSKNGVFFKTEFNLSHSPAEEFSLQYIRWPESVREITLRTAVEEVLSTLYAQKEANDIQEHQGDIKQAAAVIFGGNDVLSELERTLGIRVMGPTISAIRMDDKDQEIKSAAFKVQSLGDAIQTLVNKGVSKAMAAKLAPVVMGFITRNEVVYDIKGVGGAQSIWIGGGTSGMAPAVGTTTGRGKNGGKP